MPKSSTIPSTVASAYAKVNLPNSAGPRTRAVTMMRTRDPNRVAWPRILRAALRATRSALPGARRSCRRRPVDRQGLARRALPGERGRAGEAGRAQPLAQRRVGEEPAERVRQRRGRGLDQERRAPPSPRAGRRGSRRRRARRPPSPRGPAARTPPTARGTRRRARRRRGPAGRRPARRRRSAPPRRAPSACACRGRGRAPAGRSHDHELGLAPRAARGAAGRRRRAGRRGSSSARGSPTNRT